MKLKERGISSSSTPSQTKLKKLKISHDKLAKKEKAAIAKLIRTKDSDDIKWDALFHLYNKYNATKTEDNLLNIVETLASNFKELVVFSSTTLPGPGSMPQVQSGSDSTSRSPSMSRVRYSGIDRHLLNFQHSLTNASIPDEYVNEEMRELYKITVQNAEIELKNVENLYQTNSAIIQHLDWELSLLANVVAQLANKTEEAQMMVSEKTSDIRFVAKGIQPHFPRGPDVIKIVVLATLVGFFVAIILCIFKDFVDISEAREKKRITDA